MKEKQSNVYAILYKRQLICDDYMIFLPCYYTDGVFDSSDRSFTDNGGYPYYECDNYDIVTSSQDLTYYYDISAKDVMNMYQIDNAHEAISMFYERIKKNILIGHLNEEKRIVEVISLTYDRVKELSKSKVYTMKDGESNVTITRYQLIDLLKENNLETIKHRLSILLKGTTALEKYNKLVGIDTVIMNSSCTKVEHIERKNVQGVHLYKELEPETKKITFDSRRELTMKAYKQITASLVGQDESVQDLLSSIINNEYAKKPRELIKPLLIGQSGSGKTLFFELLSKILDKPVICINCNSIVQSGYQGQDIEDVIKRIYLLSDSDIEKAQRAIVFFDEIDKLASRGATVSDVGAQQALLKFIEGHKFVVDLDKAGLNKITLDTSMMSVVAGGAFEGLTFNKPTTLGFCSKDNSVNKITPEDLIKFGMIPELIGRFNLIVQYNPVTEDMIKKQLMDSDISPLKIKSGYYLEHYQAEVAFSESYIERVCRESSMNKAGFRGANQMINDSLIKLNFALQCEPLGDKYILIDENTIDNPKEYKIERK